MKLYICDYSWLCIYVRLLLFLFVFLEFRCMNMFIERDVNIIFMLLLMIVYSYRYCVVVVRELLSLIILMMLWRICKCNFLIYKEIKYCMYYNGYGIMSII